MKNEKLRNQNKIFENQILKACMKMRIEMKHVGLRMTHQRWPCMPCEREREIMGPKGREMLVGMRTCSFESDISLCLLCLSH